MADHVVAVMDHWLARGAGGGDDDAIRPAFPARPGRPVPPGGDAEADRTFAVHTALIAMRRRHGWAARAGVNVPHLRKRISSTG